MAIALKSDNSKDLAYTNQISLRQFESISLKLKSIKLRIFTSKKTQYLMQRLLATLEIGFILIKV